MRLLVTAGPTREAIDPVRYLSNRSSGRMGYALAEAAQVAGHSVTLVSGPVGLAAPPGVELVSVASAEEMYQAVLERLPGLDAALLAAAVADYTPAAPSPQKIKKTGEPLALELIPTRDILGSLRAQGFQGILLGFAAETENLLANARQKLQQKGCDLLAANDVARADIGFESAENEMTVLFADPLRPPVRLAKADKRKIARELIGLCEECARERSL